MSEVPGSFFPFLPRRWSFLGALLLALLLAAGTPARAQQPAAAPASSAAAAPQNKAQAASAAEEREKEKKDSHLSRSEAEELFRSADSILKFASDDTRLPIRHPVKRELASRDQVERYVAAQMKKDQESGRFKRAQSVLQKFGLIPRDLQLEPLMIELMREQVAGYYDPKKQTFYMLDWIQAESQRPVIAHELTHALQDQAVGLEKWLKEDDADEDTEDAAARLASDEETTARAAVAEGQATAVMLDYQLQPANLTVVTAQDYVLMFEQSMLQSSAFPVFSNAPLYIKASLTFPYRYGLGFVRDVLIEKGRQRAFEGLLEHPPSTTREVMEPKVYLAGERLEPMRLPPLAAVLGKGYTRYDIGVMGEFDVQILLQQFAGERLAEKLSPHWRGGYYYTAVRQEAAPEGATPDAKALRTQAVPTGSLALLYVSRWDSSESAEQFARAYAATLPQRYASAKRAPQNPDPKDFGERVANHTKWLTNEGPVFVESWGQTVLVMESFDDATAARLREAVLGPSREGTEAAAPVADKP